MIKFNISKKDNVTPFLKTLKDRTDRLSKTDRKTLIDDEQLNIIKTNYKERIFKKGLNTAELRLPFWHHGPNPITGEYLNHTGKLKRSVRFGWTGRTLQIKIDDLSNKLASLEARAGNIFDFTETETENIMYNLDQKFNQVLKDTFPDWTWDGVNYRTDWQILERGLQPRLNWKKI